MEFEEVLEIFMWTTGEFALIIVKRERKMPFTVITMAVQSECFLTKSELLAWPENALVKWLPLQKV